MAHWSENSKKLPVIQTAYADIEDIEILDANHPNVYLFLLPFPRTGNDIFESNGIYKKLETICSKLHEKSVACFLTTPEDAAALYPYLIESMKYQLWVAIKTTTNTYETPSQVLSRKHASLLVFSKYKTTLKHTKTRIKYTYCPSCGKTTKDYGGKKHTYHEYGTLISDIWRDIEITPNRDCQIITERLCDIFGVGEYEMLQLIDMRNISSLKTSTYLNSNTPSLIESKITSSGTILESMLVNKDCINALRALPDNSIDFCFADPPYNLNKIYDTWNDNIDSKAYFIWCDQWLSEMCRILKPGHTMAVLNIPSLAARHFQYLVSIMHFQNWIAWDALSFPVRMIMPAHYSILCFSKGYPRAMPRTNDQNTIQQPSVEKEYLAPIGDFFCIRQSCVRQRNRVNKVDGGELSDLWHDIHRLKHNSRRVDHPCQLPPELMKRLFAIYTKSGEMILDCFNGVGTSTLVANQMNRRYIGIELSTQYHQIAQERHLLIGAGIDPFRKSNNIPKAKNSHVQRLPKQKYQISKKVLQLDVKRIAKELGRIPNKDDVKALSQYSIDYYEKYFISWGEVCAAARTTGMSEDPSHSSPDTDLIQSTQLEMFQELPSLALTKEPTEYNVK